MIWYWEYQLNEEFRKRYGLVLGVSAEMPRKRAASQPASQRMTAAELQRLHGGLLASAPYVDLSPYRLVKAVAEQGIIITEQLAKTWASKYRTPVG